MFKDNKPRRFEDDQLHAFYLEFKEHADQEVSDRQVRIADREQLLRSMNENKEAIQELARLQTESIESTKGLVEAWDATQGAVKVSVVIGHFVKWGVGVGGPLYGLYLFVKHSGKVG